MSKVTITYKQLKEAGACESGLEFFKQLSGGKRSVTYDHNDLLINLWLRTHRPDLMNWAQRRGIVPLMRFSGCAVRDADLRYMSASDSQWYCTPFVDTNLRGANFDGASFDGSNFYRCQLAYALLRRATARGLFFDAACNLDESEWDGAYVRNTDFLSCSMKGLRASQTTFYRCHFVDVDMTGASMPVAHFIDCTFENVKMCGAYLVGTLFTNRRDQSHGIAGALGGIDFHGAQRERLSHPIQGWKRTQAGVLVRAKAKAV